MATRNAHDRDEHYRKWKRLAPLGLTTVGLGASLVGYATNLKGDDAPTWKWVLAGTASLAVLNAGLSFFGDAVKHRTLYEQAGDA
jgi:hypothetical protein